MKSLAWIIFVLCAFLVIVEGYNVLFALPVSTKSIHNLCSSLASALLERGHRVTFFTSYSSNGFHENLTHFRPYDFSKNIRTYSKHLISGGVSNFELYSLRIEINLEAVDSVWTSSEVKELYDRRNDFDAIIVTSYANEVILPFLDGYEGVFITFCPPGIDYFSISHQGNWLPLSVVPQMMLSYDEHMTFGERLANFQLFILFSVFYGYSYSKTSNRLQLYLPDSKPIAEYYEKISLMLINGHFALDNPLPLLPNQIEIGTIHIEDAKPLPQDLEDFVQGSGEDGVIYFSFGSFAMAKDMSKEKKDIFLNAFRQIPQRVIWKYEDDDLDLPPNVLIRKWLPQQDILGHPKTRIFISHCGNLGTQEARYHGVPILAIPLSIDQPRNAQRLVKKGHAVLVEWRNITSEKIVNAINEIMVDSRYEERLSNVSRILRDQKEPPGERAVWWIEYVIRHGGAPHLVYPGKRLSFFQYMMMDVVAFCVAILAIFAFLIVFLCKKTLKFFGRSAKEKKE